DVHITDSGLSGYALSETIGWINLNNVINDGAGNLSGYAWSENTGYINFNPTNGGVIINSSGEFTGSALSETIGWIVFDNCDYQVKTDWRPQSARVCVSWTYSDWSSCSNGQQTRTIISSSPAGCSGGSPVLSQSCSSGGGGGGLPPRAYNPPNPPLSSQDNPEGEFKIIINNGEQSTNSLTVNLKLFAGKDTTRMSISNNSDFKNASIIPYQETIIWMLNNEIDFISDSCKDIAIYAKFYTEYGVASEVAVAKITLAQETQNQKSKTDQKNFAYSRERLKSLPEEQNTAKELKQELENHYGKNRIPVHKKHWHTIVNSYVYGNYPINAITQAIKFGGKTVHPSIPFSAWKKAGDYSEWINK
ncbi:MAG: thrombospondin type-1 domain-containing protein, partial [Patescibacteria group bacterium]|nr:thrombospondin type-1 domain-containing protein [Patescibacteria group bacterium]